MRREKCARFWWESPKDRDHSENRGVDGRIGSKRIMEIFASGVWSGFTWLRVGIGVELF
jgi:hypothetical protein